MSISNKVKSFFQAVMKPSPAAVSQAIKSLKPHTPLIRFRKGGDSTSHAAAGGSAAGHGLSLGHPSSLSSGGAMPSSRAQSVPSTPLKPNQAFQLPIIEDWQLPQRYRRRALDAEEIDYINRGGPDYDPPAKPKPKK